MELIRQLYTLITTSHHTTKTISIIPGDNIELLSAVDEGSFEIGLTKKTYLALFKQCHEYWHSSPDSRSATLDTYYMTLGYMITTNENTTIIALHEKVTKELHRTLGDEFLLNEIDVISTFLSSRLKRINKSSSLWFLIKKYSVVSFERYPEMAAMVIARAWQSCKMHFANYYAANYLRWCSSVGIVSKAHHQKLRSLCHENLRDVSLWYLQQDVLLNLAGFIPQESASEYERFAQELASWGIKTSTLRPGTPDLEWAHSEVTAQYEWLLQIECAIATPYLTLLFVNKRAGHSVSQLVEQTSRVAKSVRSQLGSVIDDTGNASVKRKEFCEVLEHVITKSRDEGW